MICCGARRGLVAGAIVLATLAAVPGMVAAETSVCLRASTVDLINPSLGPEYSQWLVGAVSCIADKSEIERFGSLTSDEEASRFIEAFWKRHDPYPLRPDNPLRETFDQRSQEADKLYREAGYLGRRTARGTIYVLYGEPSKIDHEIPPFEGDPPIEVWFYEKDAEKGLDGRRPERQYRFIKRGDVTRFYERLNAFEQRKRRAMDPRLRPPGF